ncbi:MAG: polysaccharide biosynthesis protein [Planctomycetes bacterium]|nr:polysaccharide biosynthesis protein [Planctomycetota bacterium]
MSAKLYQSSSKPWASHLPSFIETPEPVLALLERLKLDTSLYVRRSVANNLGDIAKDHPSIAFDVCSKWLDEIKDMGEPIRVLDLAKRMVDFATRSLGREIPIAFTGLRPGEKLVEELLVDPRRSEATSHPKIFKASEDGPDRETVARLIQQLNKALDTDALPAVYGILEELVEGYGRPEASQDVLSRGDCSYSFAVNQESANGETSESANVKDLPKPKPSRFVS